MTPAQFRKIALSFPEAIESSHHGHPDFRVAGKIFATLAYPDAAWGVVILDPDEQKFYVKIDSAAFSPVSNSWGSQGATLVHLKAARTGVVRSSIEAAWRRRAPKRLLTSDERRATSNR
ncbi:MAG: MmcQ/YjbR family DNA-binding protein [Gemmatimonadota bacterium]